MSVPTADSHSCVVNHRLKDAQKGSLTLGGKYGRMFPDLPALEADEDRALGLPSGEAVARRMGLESLTEEECGLHASGRVGETLLWYYVLKEAEVRAGGEHLGKVGGRIVSEVLLGLLEADPSSYKAEPGWRPVLPSAAPGHFSMADLLLLAGISTRAV